MKRQREGGFLIAKIHQLSGRILARKLKEYNIGEINPAQGRILFVLWRSDCISIRELAEKTLLEKSTLTSMLDRLEEDKYLTRIPSREDRRKILIKLTKKNKTLRDKYMQISKEMTELFYSRFTSKKIDEFEEHLKQILDNLTSFETNRKSK